MPKLAHTKTRKGCLRCKARKVKCDQIHPVCGACQRHEVTCEYGENYIHLHPPDSIGRRQPLKQAPKLQQAQSTRHEFLWREPPFTTRIALGDQTIGAPPSFESYPISRSNGRMLELRLIHYFTAFTSLTWAPQAAETWRDITPSVAMTHEFLLDAILALAALHLSRIYPEDEQMLEISQRYFQSALEGQSHALSNVDSQSLAEALFLASAVISVHALVLTGSDNEAPGAKGSAIFRWLHIGGGGRVVYTSTRDFLAKSERLSTLGKSLPQLHYDDVVFDPANRDVLQPLLEWGTDFESISDLDRDAYEKTVSYVGLIYKVAREGGDPPLGICRRVLAMPSRCPERFIELADERRPRALAILAHLFASLKLLKVDLWWTDGLVERQVGILRDLIPRGWRDMIELPLSLVSSQGPSSH